MTKNPNCRRRLAQAVLPVACLLLPCGTASGDWEQTHKLTAKDAAEGDLFGCSVSVSENTLVVGASDDDHWAGSAYVFDVTTFEQLHKLTANDAEYGDIFGGSVSVSSEAIVVGARRDDDAGGDSGSAYVFEDLAPCPADVNGDRVVNLSDLLEIINAWGECE